MIENLWTHGQREVDAWKAAPVCDLINHLVCHYHLEARVELARMENLAEEAALRLDLEAQPALHQVCLEIGRSCREFRSHLALEEHYLFPWLLDPGKSRAAGDCGERVPPLVKLLEEEHGAETGLFQRLHTAAAGLTLPPAARDLQERLIHSFRAMEWSLQGHILLEQQVLFRRLG